MIGLEECRGIWYQLTVHKATEPQHPKENRMNRRLRIYTLASLMVVLGVLVVAQVRAEGNEIVVKRVFDDWKTTTVSSKGAGGFLVSSNIADSSAPFTSTVVSVAQILPEGYFSIQVSVTGGPGVVTAVDYEIAIDNQNFLKPTAGASIFSGSLSTNVGGTEFIRSGITLRSDLYSFEPQLAPYMRFIVTVTGAVYNTYITADLAVQ